MRQEHMTRVAAALEAYGRGLWADLCSSTTCGHIWSSQMLPCVRDSTPF
mgnify:CR=1 FL=1